MEKNLYPGVCFEKLKDLATAFTKRDLDEHFQLPAELRVVFAAAR